jgi:hypothetical protein
MLALITSFFLQGNPAYANPLPSGSIGVGAAIGAPSGFAGKLYIGEAFGVQVSLGGDLGRIGDVGFTGDFVVHTQTLNDPSDGYSLPIYMGGGLSASTNIAEQSGDTYLGPRAVLGIMIIVDGIPVDLYMEVAPTLYVIGTQANPISWGVDGQLGFRYYF